MANSYIVITIQSMMTHINVTIKLYAAPLIWLFRPNVGSVCSAVNSTRKVWVQLLPETTK